MTETTNAPDRANRLLLIAIVLIALVPALQAVTNWTPDNRFSSAIYFWRFYAPPVLAIELIIVVLATVTGFRPISFARDRFRPWACWVLLALIVIDIVTAATAADRSIGLLRCAITIFHLIFGMALAHIAIRSDSRAYRQIWFILAAGALAYMLLLIVFVASIDAPASFDWIRFGLGVVQLRHIGFYVVAGTALGLGLAATETGRTRWLAAVAIATICSAEFFWTGSRSPIVALLLVPPVSAIVLPALRTRRFAAAWLVTIIGGALLSLVHQPPSPHYGLFRAAQSSTRENANDVASGRLEIWRSSLEVAAKRPLFGYGEGQFIDVVPAAQVIYQHPHNFVLQIIVQWGFVGLLLFFPLALTMWLRITAEARRLDSPIVAGALAVNMLVFYALLDGLFFFVYPMMIWTAIVALCLAATARKAA